jgi:nicotinate (nicotinamide) nucleotide adenylyltransferase
MDIVRRSLEPGSGLAVLCGAFNPPTRAHLALAEAAVPATGEVLFVLPRRLPHKDFSGASFDRRVEMLVAATERDPRFGVALSDGGLLWEIARECRADCGVQDVAFVLGRDAAERILTWQDPALPPIEEQLREFRLLVAARNGGFSPPPELAARIQPIAIGEEFDSQSATEVRRRAAAGEDWESLVPEPIVPMVRRAYGER